METSSAKCSRYPFPGLRPFRVEEDYLYFGRESQVNRMVDKLAKRRFLAVVGTSGSGKTSLVNCGLRPALHLGLMADAGSRWQTVQFRPGSKPLRALARALTENDAIRGKFDFDRASLQGLIEASLRMSRLGLSEVFKRAHLDEGTNLLIVVDQFEELFRYRDVERSTAADLQSRREEATAFVNLLLDARLERTVPIYVVLTVRSDFLGHCAEFAGLPEAINDGEYLVPRLTRDERRAAIAGPAAVGGARISPVLLTRLVNDVGDNPDQLSILQHALNRTWAKWQGQGRREGEVDLSHYEAIGTMAHALDQHAEKAYGELSDPAQRKICEKIFKALTDKRTDPGIRRPTKFATLCELAQASPEQMTAVIDNFRKASRSFLTPPLPEPLEADTVVDISHESLMRLWERLKQWTNEEAQSAQLYRRLLETTAWYKTGKAALWSDPDLQFALDWKNKEQPTERWAEFYGGGFAEAMSFLAESERQREKEIKEQEEVRQRDLHYAQALATERQERIEQQVEATRRLRAGLAALAVVAVVLLFVAGYALKKKREANTAHDRAEAAVLSASTALEQAVRAKNRADRANEGLRLEALRVRDLNLESMSDYADLADSLLENSSPQEAARWRAVKGDALLQLGNYQDAEPLLTQALQIVPDDIGARTSRGYLFLLRGQPRAALKDFIYIRDHIDSGSALNYLNLTVAQAELTDYPGARVSLDKAIENVQSRDFDGGAEAAIPSDITEATGRTKLTADRAVFETALYYMRANLEAYAGGDKNAFQDALTRADEKARPFPLVKRNEAYFIAMTWAWLHLSARCPDSAADCSDYGALVSEAELWERAGEDYKPWADCDYLKFQRQYSRTGNSQYDSLAKLVEEKQRQLGVEPAASCFATPERDVLTLETEAKEELARKKFQEAKKLYEEALGKAAEPDEMRLLLGKAYVLYLTGSAAREKRNEREAKAVFSELKRHCDLILRKDRHEAQAYFYRAIAQDWLDESSQSSRKAILEDLEHALAINPADVSSLRLLDDLTPDSLPGDDIQYLKDHRQRLRRYYRMSPYTSNAFLHQAKLAMDDGEYKQALTFIETAIAMAPDKLSLYEDRQEIELACGIPAADVKQDLLLGYQQALFVVKRRNNPDDAALLSEIQAKIDSNLALNLSKQ